MFKPHPAGRNNPMTDTIAPSAAPHNALHLWTDGREIFIEIPGRLGPYIMRRDYDHRAIAYVFSLLGAHRIDADHVGTIDNFAYLKPSREPGTANQRAMVEAILRRNGVLK